MVDQPVARDGVEPRQQWIVRVVRVAPRMERHQRLLHQVLSILWPPAQPVAEIGAQQPRRFAQESAVRGLVAGEALEQQLFQSGVVGGRSRFLLLRLDARPGYMRRNGSAG